MKECKECVEHLRKLDASELSCIHCGFMTKGKRDMLLHLACEYHIEEDNCPEGPHIKLKELINNEN